MRDLKVTPHESYPDTHHDVYSKTIFGFWVYLVTDFMLFATFFAVHAVLFDSTAGGPSGKQLFSLPFTFVQSFLLLTCSFTSGLGGVFAHRYQKNETIFCFLVTFILGLCFMGMEAMEFAQLIASGNSWTRSAFLSSFFNLVGMHGIHMVFALMWIIVLLIPVIRFGLNPVSIKRLTCLRMFWQFLNIVWIFIFSLVYLMGGR